MTNHANTVIASLWETAKAAGYEKVRIDRAVIGDPHKPLAIIEIGYGSGTVRVRTKGQVGIWDVVDIDLTDSERCARQQHLAEQAIVHQAHQVASASSAQGPSRNAERPSAQ